MEKIGMIFLNKYPMKLNQCNCTRCSCGLNKLLDIQYDLFDIEEKKPICYQSCSKCNKLTIPIPIPIPIPINYAKNECKRNYSNIKNININKRLKDDTHIVKTSNNPFINNDKLNINKINNQLICS